MIRRLGFVFVFLICLPAFSWATSTYSDYSLGEKTPIVTEGFLNNNNGWSVGRFGKGCRSASIENGVYRIQSHCDKEYPEFWIGSVGIDEGRDFEIETRVRFVKGDSNGFYGLTWGSGIARDDKGPYRYRFGLSSNGKYTIDEYSGRWEDKKKWTKSDLIKKSAFNLLTIRKVKTDYHFFINKKYVHTSSFEPFYGPRVGFQVGQNSIIEIDKLSVSYLASSSPHLYSEYSNAQKELLFKDDFKINAKKWAEGTFGNESRRAVVKNGVYELSSLKPDSYPLFWNNGIDIDGDRDFEIEAKIRFVKGVDNNANSIFWGGGVVDESRSFYRHYFGFSGNGQFLIGSYEDGWKREKHWTETPLLDRKWYNTYTIRKVGLNVFYYINKQWVYTGQYQPFFGKRVGFRVNEKSTINVDYLKISYLKELNPQSPPEIILTEPRMARALKPVQKNSLMISGVVRDKDGIKSVSVNGRGVTIDGSGAFSNRLALSFGENEVVIRAEDQRGRVATKRFSVIRGTGSKVQKRGDRLALVIGNSNYRHAGKLSNSVNDARAMKGALEALGFKVLKYEDCDQKTMKQAIDEFGRKLKTCDVGLFYYAGHGVQVKGSNYLLPADAKLESENDVEYDSVRADRVLAKMEGASSKTNIVILDACRDNPFEKSWYRGAKGGGLAFMDAPSGSLIAYATAPGRIAMDGEGANGLYTSAILKHIQTPGITIEQMFKRVRATLAAQGGGQVPWESTSLRGDFYFVNQTP